jgi:tetratricopeptide (TPR) repeat protein
MGVLSLLLLFGSALSLIPCTVLADVGLATGLGRVDSRAVVRVASYDWKGVFLQEGWGIIVTPQGELVTAISLLDGAYFSEAIFPNGDIHIIEYIQKVNEASGLLIASLEDPVAKLPSLVGKTSFPESGSSVWVFSDSGPGQLQMFETRIEEVREIQGLGAFRYARTSVPVGGPGTPILSRSGKVAGIVVLNLPEPYGGLIIASSAILPSDSGRGGSGVKNLGVLQESWAEGRDVKWYETRRGSHLKGVTKLWSGDYEKARVLLAEAATGEGRRSGYSNLALGNCCLAGGDLDMAVEAFLAAFEKLHKSMDAMIGLSRAYLAQRKVNEAWEVYEQVATIWPQDARTTVLMAMILDASGSQEEAIVLARRALKQDPACPEALTTLGELLTSQGRFEEAAALLEKVPHSVLMERGSSEDLCYAILRSGKLARAVEVCSSAAERGETEALLYMGEAYAIMGSDEQARKCFTRYLEEAPDNVIVTYRLGDLLLGMGRGVESVQIYEKAIARRPNSDWLRYKLGTTLCLLGERELAVKQLDVLRELNPMLADQLALHLPAQ